MCGESTVTIGGEPGTDMGPTDTGLDDWRDTDNECRGSDSVGDSFRYVLPGYSRVKVRRCSSDGRGMSSDGRGRSSDALPAVLDTLTDVRGDGLGGGTGLCPNCSFSKCDLSDET